MSQNKIESLLFISVKPLTVKEIIKWLKKDETEISAEQVEKILQTMKEKMNTEESGIHLIQAGDAYQLTTAPATAELVKKFVKDDTTGELTPASLETLTVVAYRGPIAKAELEQIRGVNCSLILRNLQIRGLIRAEEDATGLNTVFSVTPDFLKFIGLDKVEDLPDYEKLHVAENLEEYLNEGEKRINLEQDVD